MSVVSINLTFDNSTGKLSGTILVHFFSLNGNGKAYVEPDISCLLYTSISQQLLPTADRKGRVAAFEIMYANSAVRNLIREAKSHQIPSIIQTTKQSGMMMMDDALYELYRTHQILSLIHI